MAERFFEIIITGRQMAAAVAGVSLAVAVAFSLGFVVRILEPVPPAPVQTVIVVATPTPAPATPTPVPSPAAVAVTPTPVPPVRPVDSVAVSGKPSPFPVQAEAPEQANSGPRQTPAGRASPEARQVATERERHGEGTVAEQGTATPLPARTASPRPSVPPVAAAATTPHPAARWVQVAAEATRSRAEGMRHRVVAAGFSPGQVVVLAGPGGLVRVRVGPFPDEESAGRIAARLHGKGFVQAFVVRKGD